MLTQTLIDKALDIVRARHMNDVALLAIADALNTAIKGATTAAEMHRPVQAGKFAYPSAGITTMMEVAWTQLAVAVLYDTLAVALQRLGETVERH